MANEKIPLMYKGHPAPEGQSDLLRRHGELHIILLQIMDTKPVGDMNAATKVSIQLQLTATT